MELTRGVLTAWFSCPPQDSQEWGESRAKRPAMRLGRGMMQAWAGLSQDSRGKVSLEGAEALLERD